jgi:hypothetical protein
MFPPGFFAADYFAPGYWPDATEAAAGDTMAAALAGAGVLVGTGQTTERAPPVAQTGGGPLRLPAAYLLPRAFAFASARVSGGADLSAQAGAAATASAGMHGTATMTGTLRARRAAVRMDNEFWLLAA